MNNILVVCKRPYSLLSTLISYLRQAIHNIYVLQQAKLYWTLLLSLSPGGGQSDLRFCENEGSNRFKINEKWGQLDRKSRRNFIQMLYNLLKNTFWWNIRPNLGPSISGTKCDREKLIFFLQNEGVNLIVLRYKIDPIRLKTPKTGGDHRWISLPCPCIGVSTPDTQISKRKHLSA